MQSIGINRAALVKDNQEILYDNDQVRIQDNILYTEKQAYDIEKIEKLPFNSIRYFIKEQHPFKGGSVEQKTLDLNKMPGINRFLTGNQEQDKQILKFIKREYRKKYDLNDLDNVQLKYDFSDAEQQIQQTQHELKQMYKMYTKQKKPEFTKEIQKASKRFFGVDYETFLKYKSQITGGQLYVDNEISDQYIEDEQRMNKQLFGGCQCELDSLFEPTKYQVLRYDGGKRGKSNNDSLIQYLYDQVKVEYRYDQSGYLVDAINSNQNKLKFLQGGTLVKPQEIPLIQEEVKSQEIPLIQEEVKSEEIPLTQTENEDDLYSEETKSDSNSDEMNYSVGF